MQFFTCARGSALTLFIACALGLTACAGIRPVTPTPPPAMTPTPTDQSPTRIYHVSPAGDDANPGTLELPWRTVNKAALTARAGDTVLIRGGKYNLIERIRVMHSGAPDAWITFKGYPGEFAVIDAFDINVGSPGIGQQFPHDDGAFQIEGVSHIRVENLHVQNSRGAGITVRDSSHVDIIGNHIDNTYSSGISVWDTNHDALGTAYIRVLSNTVTRANTFAMLPKGYSAQTEAPHEAISIGGATDFEVAWNHVRDVNKEGIDVKEVSRRGVVHHNLVERAGRQGLYVDAWFGDLEDVEIYENVVRNCQGAGFAISVEGGRALRRVRFHHNLLHNNAGTGILFGRWGGDGPRSEIHIYNNTVHRNGHGPRSHTGYFWITGGLYLYSANLSDIHVYDNIFSENRGFQIGYSEHWLKIDSDGQRALALRNIRITRNVIYTTESVESPLRNIGWGPNDYADIYITAGEAAIQANPRYVDAAGGNFALQADSPARPGKNGKSYLGAIAP